ncbi:efflux RND transporter periplasmic adaptor subunit [Candidatus Tisiphia endosymbiont of Myopa tessellatipennis]|uniref:efflux RND transporter periplasmic adaptor subunit n=1 Tax=Candidatus Tisiphia endosymbiont of Myopa tessellatipennis TaxID=3066257 RepID=UPI00313BDA7C
MDNRFKTIIIFLCICITSCYAIAEEQETIEVKATKVQMADLYNVFSVIGQCKSGMSRDYYANVSGRLDLVSTSQGGKIHQGDVLLIIDQDLAMSIKSQAEVSLRKAMASYSRDKELFAKKYISSDVLEKSSSELEEARLAFAKAMNSYNDMVLIAPFDGYIGIIKPKIGDKIKQGDYLFSIIAQNSTTNNILIELPEGLYNQVSESTNLVITDNKGGLINGKIAEISQYVSDNGTISAKIIVDSNSNIVHGSYVNIDLILNKHRNLAVPNQSVQSNNKGEYFVYKLNDNKVQQLYVKLGTSLNGLTEIISSEIREGDMVVLEGITKIYDGNVVKLLD